jgi:hypothetical protein
MTGRRMVDGSRERLVEAFQALTEEAVRAGWAEGDVAEALTELAAEYLIELSGKAITDGALHPLLAEVVPLRRH